MKSIEELRAIENVLLRCKSEANLSYTRRYRILKEVLDRICWECLDIESYGSLDLTKQLNLLYTGYNLSVRLQKEIKQFYLTLYVILDEADGTIDEYIGDINVEDAFARDYRTVSEVLQRTLVSKKQGNSTEDSLIVDVELPYKVKRLRTLFEYKDETYLYVDPVDFVSVEPLKVKYNVQDVNDEFITTCSSLWKGAQLNLLEVSVDSDGILLPEFFVLEPDYLLDISTLAECYKPYGAHPLNYILSKLTPISNSIPILLGNIVNLFLDEWIYSVDDPNYIECMIKAFRMYPLELASCRDLQNKALEREFAQNCKMHFEHIGWLLKNDFFDESSGLDRHDAVLEPSYICEALGLQGRLDYMQRDQSALIEMKSGRADEFTLRANNQILPYENHRIQMLLYMAVLYFLTEEETSTQAFLLYTRYPKLCHSAPSWGAIKKAINLRNGIVSHEFQIQEKNDVDYTAKIFQLIKPDELRSIAVNEKFWTQYLLPPIEDITNSLKGLTELERIYFLRLYNFITKELFLSKAGSLDFGRHYGAASLWLSPFLEKVDRGEILYDLEIISNHAAEARKAFVKLRRPTVEAQLNDDLKVGLPNFRLGDAVILYPRNKTSDKVTNQRVFKGNICEMTSSEITIRLRASQRNEEVLPLDSRYAIEHDTMDVGFRNMFLGLYWLLKGSQDRRDLLLNQRAPEMDNCYDERISETEDDFERLALKALAAKDYFLVVGPPGTGKTSRALRRMVEKFYEDEENQILLMAYTNRAVDEICKTLEAINPPIKYIRIGSELSCGAAYRSQLIENQLEDCVNRAQVSHKINQSRVFVGTVASISGKKDLFDFKQFDVAIIDEASQILESQLLGILMACDEKGKNAIGKFVLIGDHKQLPAIVLQGEEESEVREEELRAIGIKNLRNSLFERLYFNSPRLVVDQLCKQGRMHPIIADFPNRAFYDGKLESLGLPHQVGQIKLKSVLDSDSVLSQRVAFIPSRVEDSVTSCKVNSNEAEIVTQLIYEIYKSEGSNFNPNQSVGVITPFRSQIALIKDSIAQLNIECLKNVIVDTVERFQGSERDIIIYSFCVNNPFQLRMLPNLMQEKGVWIDRKLNVVLTRARKQLFVTGVEALLRKNAIYAQLIDSLSVNE